MTESDNGLDPKRLQRRTTERLRLAARISADVGELGALNVKRLVENRQRHLAEPKSQNEDLEECEHELERIRDDYSHLYDFAPVGYLTLGSRGRILQSNLTFCHMLQVGREAVLRRPLSFFVHGDSLAAYVAHQNRVMVHEHHLVCDVVLIRADGTRLNARLESVRDPTIAPHSSEMRWWTTVHDISELKSLEQSLREARDAAEAAAAAKSRFLNVVGHDLRQPLQALMLLLDAITRRSTELRIVELARSGEMLTREMSHQIGTLLEIAWIERGDVDPRIEALPLDEVFETIRQECRDAAVRKGLDLRVPPTVHWVMSDRRMLTSMIRNLASNAVAYTEQGRVEITVRDFGRAVRIEVTDTGPGIPRNQTDRIFEEFVRLRRNGQEDGTGLGLGLSIVRRFADMLDHPVVLKTRHGEGSTFGITVPKP